MLDFLCFLNVTSSEILKEFHCEKSLDVTIYYNREFTDENRFLPLQE